MSLNTELPELTPLINRLMDNLSKTLTSQTGRNGAELRNKIGDIRARFQTMIMDETFSTKLLECFTLAKDSGATLSSLASVHSGLFAETPVGDYSAAVVQTALVFCLSTEAEIAAAATFTSRDDVETMMRQMNRVFDTARLLLADGNDSSVYLQLVNLAGSLTDHLANTARPLARMVTFELSMPRTALSASQFVYYTADRWEELVDENKVVHPAFMPRTLRGLSA